MCTARLWVVVFCACAAALPLASSATAGPEIPGAEQQQPIALVGGTIHPIDVDVIPQGTLLMEDGRITAVAREVLLPENTRQVDIRGQHVYPGLFDAATNIGLVEINAVRATRDHTEIGLLNPNVRAEVAVNPDSELIPVTRANGVLLCLTAPAGELVAGMSAVVQLDGWTWEEMTLRSAVGLHVQWPNMAPLERWYIEESSDEQLKNRDEQLRKLDEFFADARAYATARRAADAGGPSLDGDPRLEAMAPILSGDLPAIVAADTIGQIESAVAFAVRENVRMILLGGYDAPLCADLLKRHKIPVIVTGVYRLPSTRSDAYDDPYTLPERLRKAGIRFCITSSARFGASNVRNLPYNAAMAVAHGLPPAQGLRAITLSAAEILGVDDRVGSLQPSKDATLIITDGDPLETTTHVVRAYIQGREVDLDNRHKRLWRKYQEKYERLGNQ